MVKGTVKYTGKFIWMRSRHPLAKTACYVGFIHFVNTKLALRHVDEIKKRVGVHNFKVGFDGGDKCLVGSDFGE